MFGVRGADGMHVLSHAAVPRPTEAVNVSFLIQITKENTAIMMGLPGTTPEYVEEHLVQVGDEFLHNFPATFIAIYNASSMQKSNISITISYI